MKVLLVEDDTALAQALGEALGEAGLLWEHAETGHAADYLVRVESYDAVILDLGLPDGDGTRWLAAWREDGIDLPVLVLTARERWSDKAAGFPPAPMTMSLNPSKPPRCCFVCGPWCDAATAIPIPYSDWASWRWIRIPAASRWRDARSL